MKKRYILSLGIIGIMALLWFTWPSQAEQLIAEIPERGGDREVQIVAFGDSLTAGYGVEPSASYPAQLERMLRERGLRVRVTNAGVSGETSGENLLRAEEIRDLDPDVVLLGIGGNDALQSLPVPTIKANITATIDTLETGVNPPVVVLLKMQSPFNAGLSYKQEFDALYEEIADERPVILLPFVTAEIYLEPQYRQVDIIHLTEAGYAAVIEEYLAEPLQLLVERLGG